MGALTFQHDRQTMKFVLFILFFCAICFFFQGIFASIRTIIRGIRQLTEKAIPPKDDRTRQLAGSTDSDIRICCTELQELFMMHQSGALTRDEFQQLKRHVLSTFKSHQHAHQEIS
jgi:hypothetical protein